MQASIVIPVLLTLFCCQRVTSAQQVPDAAFDPVVKQPVYAPGKGSLVLIDEAHHNFHTLSTRYGPFARVLSNDGYRVEANKTPFSAQGLTNAHLLVIANAIHESDTTEWVVPNPSAFTTAEVAAVKQWVEQGGSLLFIADHMPFPGAGQQLANAFGVTFYNGFASDTTAGLYPGSKKELDVFNRTAGTLANHPITNGRNQQEIIHQVATFTGQGFAAPSGATSLLTFNGAYTVLLPDTAWKFSAKTRRLPAKGLSQGAVLPVGKGRVAVFGEAAMFTAQRKGKDKIPFGLNAPDAPENLQFLLNLVHWLDHKL